MAAVSGAKEQPEAQSGVAPRRGDRKPVEISILCQFGKKNPESYELRATQSFWGHASDEAAEKKIHGGTAPGAAADRPFSKSCDHTFNSVDAYSK